MKKAFVLTCLLCKAFLPFAQDGTYFQQEVNYKIQVTLDDRHHTLTGNIEFEYINNSPDELTFIYFHLWGNAFKEPSTAFARQKLRSGSTKFYFAKDSTLGYYSGLDFTVDGLKAEWSLQKDNPDIAVLQLPRPLKNKEKISIATPFSLKIPDSFSRLGHVGESYQMTQWYPKPAVYDNRGWHPMPYLEFGEYYSEFGTFDVSITLPENYVVGATGVLQSADEKAYLAKKAEETKSQIRTGFSTNESFPPSSSKLKTLRYIAENVHDFAWFADKRFHVLKGEVRLPSGKKIDTWTMFTNSQAMLWERSIDYVNRAVAFYSEHVGEYPYPQATAVHSALSAGGGMEYPMITVIGNSNSAKDLDQVITHEIGHNWFYGILASNERDYAWMDEGINSYYEYRYMQQYYGDKIAEVLPGFIKNSTDLDLYEVAYLFQARRRLDQAPQTGSDDFNPINYAIGAYLKPGLAFSHLEHYLGTSLFDSLMHQYFETWKFKHPYPDDLQKLLEQGCNKPSDWFFEGYLASNHHLDYSLERSTETTGGVGILVKNRGEIAAPFPISGLKDGEIVITKWFEGFTGEQEVVFPTGGYDQFVLDANHITLDVFRKNNRLKTKGAFRKTEPFRLQPLVPIENSNRTMLSFMPILGFNKYDGLMPGLAFYNALVPANKFEFVVAPVFGFSSKDINGLASLAYNIFPESEKIKKISLGLKGKAFHFRSLDSLRTEPGFASTSLQFRRLVPFVKVDLTRSPTSKFYQTIQFRSIILQEQGTVFESGTSGFFYRGNDWENSFIHELSWELGNNRALNPYNFRLVLEQQGYDDIFQPEIKRSYLKVSVEIKSDYTFDRGRNFSTRLFFGGFLKNEAKEKSYSYPGAFNLTSQGFNDYRYDDLYAGRTEATGFYSRQIFLREGGMKIALGSPYSEGRSRDFVLALNLKSDLPEDLPGKLPIKPYFDIAYYSDARTISSDLTFEDQLWWQGGFALEFGKGILGIYFPVVNSSNVKDLYKNSGRSKFLERITFSLDLAKLSPWYLVDNYSF